MNEKTNPSIRYELLEINNCTNLKNEWKLLEDQSDCSPFVSWNWVSVWLNHLPERFRPLVFRARDQNGLFALGLLVEVRERGLRQVFGRKSIYLQETGDTDIDEVTIEYAGLLLRRGAETQGYQALFEQVTSLQFNWRRLRISACSHASAIIEALPLAWRAFSTVTRSCYLVDLAKLRSGDKDYLAQLGTRTRQGLRRTRRAYEALGELQTGIAAEPEQALRWLDELRVLHARHWESKGQQGAFASGFFAKFHHDLVNNGTASGFTQLMRITAGPVVVGYLYNIVWRNRVYFYNGGLNYGVLDRLDRPGYLAQLLAIERHLADGLDVYDFMAGDQEYKRTLGDNPETLNWIDIRQFGWRLTLERSLSRLARRALSLPLSTGG